MLWCEPLGLACPEAENNLQLLLSVTGLSKTVLVSKFWSYKQTQFSNSWHSLWIANGECGLETATEKADTQTDLVIFVKHIFRKEVGSQHILKKVSS